VTPDPNQEAITAALKDFARQVWDAGYEAGKRDGYLDSIDYPTEHTNPYEETP